jgi:hypothetical protein
LHRRRDDKLAAWGCEFASGTTLLLIDLISSFVPTSASRSLTFRVSVATGMRNFLAAADKLPSSTEDTSMAMASSRSNCLTKKGKIAILTASREGAYTF